MVRNLWKMTALVLSLMMLAGLFSGCSRSDVRTEGVGEPPYGESQVREDATEENRSSYGEEIKEDMEKGADVLEQSTQDASERIGEKGKKVIRELPFVKESKTSSRTIQKEENTTE